ncbi:hypothetical protein D3C87_279580 [compost metagenome]
MEFVMLLYLVVLGLNIGLMPRVIAVIDKSDYKALAKNNHVLAAVLLGLIPLVNVVFLFAGSLMLSTILRLHREYDGVIRDRIEFNQSLKKVYGE